MVAARYIPDVTRIRGARHMRDVARKIAARHAKFSRQPSCGAQVARSTDARHSCFGAIIVRACMSADFLWILLSLS